MTPTDTTTNSAVYSGTEQVVPDLSHNGNVALAYARAGFYVFPCNAERKEREDSDRLPFGKADKRPLVSSWSKEASKDERQIQQWWNQRPEALVGLPCKQNRLLVIDADRHTNEQDGVAQFATLCEGRDEPMLPHPVIRTDYEGEHHVFRMPDEPIGQGKNKLPPGVDIRGYRRENDGGYIIAAGSRMPDGRGWGRMKGTPSFRDPLPPPPQWLVDLCKPPKPQANAQTTHNRSPGKAEEAYAMAALNRAAVELAQMKPSTGRDNRLMSVAGTMGRMIAPGWIGQATVEGRLFDACRANGLADSAGETEILDKIRRGIEATISNPHPPLPERAKSNGKDTEAAKQQEQPAHDWSDPDWSLLDDRRGELPEFPMNVFSAKVQEVIKRTAKGAGVTPAHIAVPLIGIVSSLIGTARRVKATSSWLQCTTCWTVLVGFSGTGKTPGINVTKRALNQLERNNKTADDERRRKHETKQEIAAAMRKCWEKNVKDAIENGMPAPPMPAGADDSGKFIPIKLWVADSTIERLADLLSARPQGVLVLRDELSALFTNMSRYSNGQDNEFWLEAWNGDAFSQERMSRMVKADHLLIGIAGGMQPDKLAKSFEGDHDGMYARVLFSWPPEPGYSPLSDEAQEIDTDILNIITRVNKLAEFTPEGGLVVKVIPLSDEARDGFAQFRQFAHEAKETFEGREREWFAKATAHVLRLAGTLTFLEWGLDVEAAKAESVDKARMVAAIKLVRDYFWPHARACLRQIGLTERHANARRVLKWLRAKGRYELSREDVRRDALGQRLDADETTELLADLVRHGWLKDETMPSGPQGGKPVRRWHVNPKLFSDPTAQTAQTAETPS
jgi:hypothetical protein